MNAMNLVFPASLALLVFASGCASKAKTYNGIVTTTMCGTHHFAGMTPAECVRKCFTSGSQYVLVVDDKPYKLEGNTAGLDAYAGEKASVFGTASRSTIQVISVSALKG